MEVFEDLRTGGGDEGVGLFAPGVFYAFATGIMMMVIVRQSIDDGLGAEALAGGVEIS